MLDRNVESENNVYVSGVLKELDIKEGVTNDGRSWVNGTAYIQVDQDINGEITENVVPIKMFSMQKKKDGSINPNYTRILGYRDSFVSAAIADENTAPSNITVSLGKIDENIYIDRNGKERSTFQISSNFLNNKRPKDDEGATFDITGVFLCSNEEVDKEENPTGRLVIKFGVLSYGGKINVLTLYAEGNAKAHIEQNWNDGDTVRIVGKIKCSQKTESYMEEIGFGEPIKRTRTISSYELIVSGGSATGFQEYNSYDADSIKQACDERLQRIAELREKPKKTTPARNTISDFGF